MPLCGFDEQMLTGLRMFHNGLKEAVVRRAREDRITIEVAIDEELKEMDQFLKEMPDIRNPLQQMQLIGITRFARSFYENALKQSKEKKTPITNELDNTDAWTRKFLQRVDEEYYGRLKGRKRFVQKKT